MEIVVDACDEWERAMSWYYYLENNLRFPFSAACIAKRATSPLKKGDKIEVIGMPPEKECEHEMFVVVRWGKDKLAVPLSQLKAVGVDKKTQEAIDDWHYWVEQGYQF